MVIKNILISIVFLILFNGCSSLAKVEIIDDSVKKIDRIAYIKKSDVTKTSSDFGRTFGLMFPINVDLGQGLKNYADLYFSKVKVIDPSKSNDGGVHLSLKSFDIIDSYGLAGVTGFSSVIEIHVVVNDKDNRQLLSKSYKAKGNLARNSSAHSVAVRNMEYTSGDAFQKVFLKIKDDLNSL